MTEPVSGTFAPIPGTLVIGLGHKARHGKDSAARYLMHAIAGVQRFSFADDLYAICRVLHGMAEKDPLLLQRVGLEYREKDEDVWVRSVYAKLLAEQPRVAVITDVRYPNEFELVKGMGGVCWKIERRYEDGALFVDPGRPATHISETALDGATWDRVIENPNNDPFTFRDRVLCAYHALAHELECEPISVGKFGYVLPDYMKAGIR